MAGQRGQVEAAPRAERHEPAKAQAEQVGVEGELHGGRSLRASRLRRYAAKAGNQATMRAMRRASVDAQHEREADSSASAAVRAIRVPEPQPIAAPPRRVASLVGAVGLAQLKAEIGEGLARHVGETLQGARAGGRPLESGLRTRLDAAMQADFSGVRIHDDARADRLNHALGSRAFTSGRDVFFRGGHWRPHTEVGRELLAHELTHVVQQGGDRGSLQRKIGFEFQTVKPFNPKVVRNAESHTAWNTDLRLARREANQDLIERIEDQDTDTGTTQRDLVSVYYDRDHGKEIGFANTPCNFEVDKGDVEVVTHAFNETEEGRDDMLTEVSAIVQTFEDLYNRRKQVWTQVYKTMKTPSRAIQMRPQGNLVPLEMTATHPDFDQGIREDWRAIVWPRNNGGLANYGAAIQSTMGVRLEALGELVAAQIASGTDRHPPMYPDFTNGRFNLGQRSMSRETVRNAIVEVDDNVRRWVQHNIHNPREAALLGGLLRLVGMRFAHAAEIRRQTNGGRENKQLLLSYSKDYAIIMNRTALGEIQEQLIAEGLGVGLWTARQHPEDVFGPRFTANAMWMPELTTTVDEYLMTILDNRSEAATLHDAAIGILSNEDTAELDRFEMTDALDIGPGYDAQERKGVVVELRQLSLKGNRPPMREWLNVCDALFRGLVYLNSGNTQTLDLHERAQHEFRPRQDIRRAPQRPQVQSMLPTNLTLPSLTVPSNRAPLPTGLPNMAPLPNQAPLPTGLPNVAPLPNRASLPTGLPNVAPIPNQAPQANQQPANQQPANPRNAQARPPRLVRFNQQVVDAARRLVRSRAPASEFRDPRRREAFIDTWSRRVLMGEFGDFASSYADDERAFQRVTRSLTQAIATAYPP